MLEVEVGELVPTCGLLAQKGPSSFRPHPESSGTIDGGTGASPYFHFMGPIDASGLAVEDVRLGAGVINAVSTLALTIMTMAELLITH